MTCVYNMRPIIEAVNENIKRLDGCKGPHSFQDVTPNRQLGKLFRCYKCQGEVDIISKRWYEAGLLHGAEAQVSRDTFKEMYLQQPLLPEGE